MKESESLQNIEGVYLKSMILKLLFSIECESISWLKIRPIRYRSTLMLNAISGITSEDRKGKETKSNEING